MSSLDRRDMGSQIELVELPATAARVSPLRLDVDLDIQLEGRCSEMHTEKFPDEQSVHNQQDVEGAAQVDLVSVDESTQRNVSELAPTDGGFRAWAFLTAAFFVEGVVWAFPTSYGVLLNAYIRDPTYNMQKDASDLLPVIGTIAQGLMHLIIPFIFPALNRYPRFRRPIMYAGFVLTVASLLAASFATTVTGLFALQGILYAIGGALLWAPCFSFMSEWFVRRQGFASGVLFAGTSVGGVFLPIVLPILVDAYGPAITLRILAVAIIVLVLPGMPFIRPRLPERRVHAPNLRATEHKLRHLELLKNPRFVLGLIANTLQGTAYFVPLLWITVFAAELNLSDFQAALALSLINGSAIFSRIAVGHLSDKWGPWHLAASTSIFTSVATLVLWGVLSYNLAGILVFGFVYGALACGYPSLWAGFIKPFAKDDPKLSSTLFGFYLFTRGIGCIISAPISTALSPLSLTTVASSVDPSSFRHPHLGFDVADGQFAKVIIFTGTCFAGVGVTAIVGLAFNTFTIPARRANVMMS